MDLRIVQKHTAQKRDCYGLTIKWSLSEYCIVNAAGIYYASTKDNFVFSNRQRLQETLFIPFLPSCWLFEMKNSSARAKDLI